MNSSRTHAVAALWAVVFGSPAFAGANLVVNGGFEQTSFTTSQQMNTTNVTGWSTSGYNFIFMPGTADTTGSYTPQFNNNVTLWGPNDGSANGLPATSPAGGNFVGADGAFEVGAITQTINGLTVGSSYNLSFYWAAGQQTGFIGQTTENWTASLGSQSFTTNTVTTPSQGFTPWTQATFVFTATSTSEVLSFLAAGTPSGQPPFSLLDGVSLTAAPEPASLGLLLVTLVGLLLGAARSGGLRAGHRLA